MLKQYSFWKKLGFEKHNSNGQVIITDVDSEGDSLEELIENATIGLEDWNGNTLQHIKLHDLSEPDYSIVLDHVQRTYELQKAQDSRKQGEEL